MKSVGKFLLVIALSAVAAGQGKATKDEAKPASVEGSVVNSVTGEPLAHARVRLFEYKDSGSASYGTTTKQDGRFSIKSVAPREYAVLVERSGFISLRPLDDDPGTQQTLKPGEELKNLTFKLLPSAAITGRVLTPDGAPAEAVTVDALGIRGWSRATTNNKGEFRLGGLPPGKYLVVAWFPNHNESPAEIRSDGTTEANFTSTFYPSALLANQATPVEVGIGAETHGIEIRLRSVPIVQASGRVEGIPRGCTWLHLWLGQPNDWFYGAKDGTFITPRLHPGTWRIGAACLAPDGRSLHSAPIEIEVPGQNLENVALTLMPLIEITGKLEAPVTDAKPRNRWETTLRLRALGALKTSDIPWLGGSVTDEQPSEVNADGTFGMSLIEANRYYLVLNGFPENSYVKSIRAGDQESYGGIVDLRHGSPVGPLKVNLGDNGAEISGVVHGQNGERISTKILVLLDSEFGLDAVAEVKSGKDGSYSVKGLAPGKYKLLAGYHDYFAFSMVLPLYESIAQRVVVKEGEKIVQDLRTAED